MSGEVDEPEGPDGRARQPVGVPRRLDRGRRPARSPRCWGRTAPASRAWCWPSAACCKPLGGTVTLTTATSPARRPEKIRQAGVAIVPEGRRLLPDADGRGQPPRRDLYAVARRRARRTRARARAVPRARKRLERGGAVAVGRRAADGRPRAGARLGAKVHDHRRAVARPGARGGPAADPHLRRSPRPASGSC